MTITVNPITVTGNFMTNLLAGIKQADKVEATVDVLASDKFAKVESGVYDAVIKFAYLKPTVNGSLGLHTEFELDTGVLMRESFYLTNTSGENFYLDKEDPKKKHLLPGYIMADSLALLGAQKPIAELNTEERIIKLRDYDLQKDVPTPVQMLVALVDKPVRLGIIKVVEDKRKKTDQLDSKGKPVYVATGETFVKNAADKVFHLTNNMTVAELRAGATEAAFIEAWKEKWEGKTYDKSTADKGNSVTPAAAKKASTASLFSN